MCSYIYVYKCKFTYDRYMNVSVYMFCECKFVCVHLCVCVCANVCAHTYVYIYAFIYITMRRLSIFIFWRSL